MKRSIDSNKFKSWKPYYNIVLDTTTYCNAKCPQCHRTNPNGLDKQDWLPHIQWSINDFKKAFPNEPVPPVINTILFFN